MPKDARDPPEDLVPDAIRASPFPYMRWAKQCLDPADPQSLGLSGLARPPGAVATDAAPPFVGHIEPVLKQALAQRYGMEAVNVHLAAGSSAANFLVYHVFARNGRVATETPTYEALPRLAPAVGAALRTFERDRERGWRIDPDSLARATEDGVDLLAVTDLHNPSGARLAPEDLALLVEVADAHDAVVLVDEVYLDFDPENRPTAAHASNRVLVTSSLTKAHGLGPLRSGWILGSPANIETLALADDLVNPVLPYMTLAATFTYLPYADRCLAETRSAAAARLDVVDAWVEATPGVSWVRPAAGITGFLDLPGLDGEAFCTRLMQEHGIRAVPGSFFGRPEGIRISFLLDEDALVRALEAMGAVLGARA